MTSTSLVDLTAFGFTPTEGLVYGVLLRDGPGTGYAIARGAGLARANAYSALEGLVTKGAARVEGDRPKMYRPEPPAALVARIADSNGEALERLSDVLHAIASPVSTADVEITTARGAFQIISHDVARATRIVALLGPADAYAALIPALRRPAAANITLRLASTTAQELDLADVTTVAVPDGWPGEPIIAMVDDRTCVLAARSNGEVRGHWSTSPVLVASARNVLRAVGVAL